jgi:hypothetical protein
MATTTPARTPRKRTAPKPADLNEDGKVTNKERAKYRKDKLAPDRLSQGELAQDYGYALRVMKSDPELWDLFQKATNGRDQWTKDKFTAALMNSRWWAENSEYARKGLTAKAMGGADWDQTLATARVRAQEEATRQGAKLTDAQLASLSEDIVMNGWDQADRGQMLATKIAEMAGVPTEDSMLSGNAGDLQQRLMDIAEANGLTISRDYAAQAAKSVAMGLSTDEDWMRQTREQAASLWGPGWQDKILAGVDAKQLASGYINMMAQEFEMNPESISLNDPYLRKAMTKVDQNGNAQSMSLFDFQQQLRNDPRWMGTKNAEDKVSSIGNDILRMFGFAG